MNISMDKKFNLIDEPWLIAEDSGGKRTELSLRNIFARAHELRALAGELPAQDVAILRLLLSIMHAVYTRTDEYKKCDIVKEAADYWKGLWVQGSFGDAIDAYLTDRHERFYLFHPERPFYQIADESVFQGKTYGVRGIIGDISEGDNKKRQFGVRLDSDAIDYPEAARWLIYHNAFDATVETPQYKERGLSKKMNISWCGELGLVYAEGKNLFETLMLNFVLFCDGKKWEDAKAAWEKDSETVPFNELPLPKSQIELLTLQSRRMKLVRVGERVIGIQKEGGELFDKTAGVQNLEQMTLFRQDKDGRGLNVYLPKKHREEAQLWRGFAALVGKAAKTSTPGLFNWIENLYDKRNPLISRNVSVCAAQVSYKSMNGSVKDVWGDSFSIHTGVFAELDGRWINEIIKAIDRVDKMVSCVGKLALEIEKAGGWSGDKPENIQKPAREQAYSAIDLLFRRWLAGINPENLDADVDVAVEELLDNVYRVLLKVGEGLVSNAGEKAMVGRIVNDKAITAASAFVTFKLFLGMKGVMPSGKPKK
ncbi:MAG: type I-E CRISPR-associated protein Cse1/CasA [Oscillospiraceae bacterium]|nr:type I-E CRISPR-associated protein Cse1/CasA [Oscillospiraceae bacterium]